jgi:hypothetical protein
MNVYKHSGAVGALGPVYVTIAGFVSAGVLGVVYAYAINWIPLIYITFLLTLALGFGMGIVVGHAAKFGKVRNPIAVTLFGLIFGLIALYVAWAFDPMVRFPENVNEIVWNPSDLQSYVAFGYENGFWSIGRGGADAGNVSGIFLALVWMIEAGIIVGLATMMASGPINEQPFCELSGEWANREDDIARLEIPEDEEGTLDRLLEGEVEALSELRRADNDLAAYLRLDLSTCPQCADSNWLTINVVVHGVDKEGKPTTEITPLATNMEISEEHIATVRSGGRELTTEEVAEREQPVEAQDETQEGDEPSTEDFNFS